MKRWAAAIAALWLANCNTRDHEAESNTEIVAELDLTGGLPDGGDSALFGPTTTTHFADWVLTSPSLRKSRPKGLFVRIGQLSIARALEVGGTLAGFRGEIPVVCHAHQANLAAVLLMHAGCTERFVSPAGGVDAFSPSLTVLLFGGLLQRLGVQADFVQVGAYKGASDPFTRQELSPEARQSYETLISGLRAAATAALSNSGTTTSWDTLVSGPYSSKQALDLGLMTRVGTVEEARSLALEQSNADEWKVRFGRAHEGSGLAQLTELIERTWNETRDGNPHVALITAHGPISMEASGGLFGSSGISERGLGRLLSKMEKSDSVRAIVLRMDSPGGSALASDLLWKRLMHLKAKKPVVVSVGDMAASGGYYIASAATTIFADSASIVGSIGVVSGKLALGPALEPWGIHAERVGGEGRGTYGSLFEPWDAATRAQIVKASEHIYELFLSRIVEGRSMDPERLKASAEGRLFSGAQAKERGLVDEIGGLEQAVARARDLSGLGGDAPVVVAQERGSVLEWLEEADEDARATPALLHALPKDAAAWVSAWQASREELHLTILPEPIQLP